VVESFRLQDGASYSDVFRGGFTAGVYLDQVVEAVSRQPGTITN